MKKLDIIKYFFISLLAACSSENNFGEETNNSAEILNIKTLGGSGNDSAQSVVNTSDGGYVVVGYTQSSDGDVEIKNNFSYDYWIIKFDEEGNQEWQKFYGGSKDDKAEKIIKTKDQGYAIVGRSKSNDMDVNNNEGLNDIWVTKIDLVGDIQWEKSFGYSGTDKGFSITQTQDNGFFIVGISDLNIQNGDNINTNSSSRHAGGDFCAIKLNPNGETHWIYYFGGTFTDTPYAALESNDGNFIIVGSSDSSDGDISVNKGSYDYWVIKISPQGDLVWEKSYGGSEIDKAREITETVDGNFMIVGDTRSSNDDVNNNYGSADVWIIKINSNGDLLWEKSYGGSSFDGVQAIHRADDGYIVAGNSRSINYNLEQNNGQNDAWFFKINEFGVIKWQSTIGGSNIDLLMDITQLTSGSIICVGNTASSDLEIAENKGLTDLLIVEAKPFQNF